jgi:hypothetical protein
VVPWGHVGSQKNHGTGKAVRDGRLAAIAAAQDGLVSLRQLREIEVSRRAASHRTKAATLHRIHRGVYAAGHPAIGRIGVLRAAVLACGDGAAISHLTAAAFWGIRDQWPVLVDVIVRSQQGRRIDGIRSRRCRYPAKGEVVSRGGVVCTTPARTLVDVAGLLGNSSLRRAVERAAVLKLLDLQEMDATLARARRRPGVRALRAILEDWRTPDGSVPDVRSDFEALVLPRLVRDGLPRPAANVPLRIEGECITVDFLWQTRGLVVETDGEATHGTPVAFRRDRKRDQKLVAAGFRVARVTWDQIHDELPAVLARIRRALQIEQV